MKLGIVGLPNVGKSTLFNAITKAGAQSANYPFCTIEPNIGVVDVPDERLKILAKINNSQKIIPTSISFYDIAGLVKGASKGEGLGNQFLSHIREVDAILHVVRCFDDENVIHVDGSVSASRDIETIELELILADIQTMSKHASRIEKLARSDKSIRTKSEFANKLLIHLEEGNTAISMDIKDEEKLFLKEFQLLTSKGTIFVANVSVDISSKEEIYLNEVEEIAKTRNAKFVKISAQIEEEIAQLEDDEKQEFLDELNLKESGLDSLIKESYKLLDLISFLTTGPKETRAWTIKKGTTAQKAAGKIHSDIERGFIRAETIGINELIDIGSLQKAKELGKLRLEGKEYIMNDGDVVLFRFNV